jgi:molybdopterin-guanine dinucleotide biosynthesis protein A
MERGVPAVILAGGQGRRMGGAKAFVPLAGRPLIAHVIDRIAPQCRVLAVNSNAGAEDFAAQGIDLPLVPDAVDLRGMGPLAGIWAAMTWAVAGGFDKVLTVPVDTPFLPVDLAARLSGADAPLALAQTEDGLHGTCGLWPVALRDPLRAALEQGQRKVTDFTAQHGAVGVRFDDTQPPPFFNVNRPEDLTRAERWAV